MSQETKIKAGDVVYLKSGSKALTVVYVDFTTAKVIWWDSEEQNIKEALVTTDCLELK